MLLRSYWLVSIACLLAFAFLGTRGVWDPDEGRYTNVALVMLDSGDWLSPMRNAETGHWTKPPMTYWLIAAIVATFGQTPWAARLPIALAYLPLQRLQHRRLNDHRLDPAASAVGRLRQVFRWGHGPACGKRSEHERTDDERNPHILNPYILNPSCI